MTFLWPHMLWLLLTVPLFVALYVFLLRRKRNVAIRYATLTVIKDAMGSGPGIRRHLPAALLLLAWTTAVVAVARPAALITLPSQRDTVVLAMDVSGSMRATDVDPSRLAAAQDAAKEFVAAQPKSTRIGIVAFGGSAMLVQAPTLERTEIRSTIDRFRLQRGTNIGAAILTSLQTIFPEGAFELGPQFMSPPRRGVPLRQPLPSDEPDFSPVEPGSHGSAVVVLLTDGQSTRGPDPVEAARMAADRGVRLFTVGFGTEDGEIVSFRGYRMQVQLDEETLKQVADVTRGRYFHAATATDLSDVYRSLTSQFVLETEETEITAFYAAAAGLLMLLGGGLSLLWFSRIV